MMRSAFDGGKSPWFTAPRPPDHIVDVQLYRTAYDDSSDLRSGSATPPVLRTKGRALARQRLADAAVRQTAAAVANPKQAPKREARGSRRAGQPLGCANNGEFAPT